MPGPIFSGQKAPPETGTHTELRKKTGGHLRADQPNWGAGTGQIGGPVSVGANLLEDMVLVSPARVIPVANPERTGIADLGHASPLGNQACGITER